MFTGIVEGIGTVAAIVRGPDKTQLTLRVDSLASTMEVGDSISVNGVCLTAVQVISDEVAVDVIAESLRRSNLGTLEVGDSVNLERPLPATGRFDGHIVQGHVDATSQVVEITPVGASRLLRLRLADDMSHYVVEKGSIAVDGVSLTVAGIIGDAFEVALIPHTLAVTTLGLRRPGDQVNLEFDVIAKYVERMLERPR